MIYSLEILKVFLSALVGWWVLWGFFVVAEKWPRMWFILAHYTVSIVTFLLVIWVYLNFIRGNIILGAFPTMIAFMVSLFVIEICFFGFVYDKPLWFLNFTDWIVPVFLIASTIYLLSAYLIKS